MPQTDSWVRTSARRVRGLLIAGLSVVVIAGLAGYAALTPTQQVEASTSVSWTTGSGEVVYGWVHNDSGGPIQGAVVQVVRFGAGGRVILYRQGATAANGTYRLGMHLRSRTYWVLIHMGPSGAAWKRVAALRHTLSPGMHLKADAKVVNVIHFWILPVTIY